MKALAPLKTSVNLFGYIVRSNPLNPHLKPCAINTANPILQVKKTDPKNQISRIKTPHPIVQASSVGLTYNELKRKTVRQ